MTTDQLAADHLATARAAALECIAASENDTMSFPEQLGKLVAAGIEGYYADLRNATRTHYLAGGETIELPTHRTVTPAALAFAAQGVEAAVRQAQAGGPDYSYKKFCEQIMAAGCPAYLVSVPGRRVVYFGRTAETHVEHFLT